ncbi:cupin domain-containing protein [Candidatus Bipolaricaulota bacterium]
MAPTKHLVLDEDIHKALMQRREMTGLPISQLGNSILRGHIAATLLENLLGQHLIDKGFISTEQYQEVLEQVDHDLRDRFRPGTVLIEQSEDGNLISGSWEIKNLFEDPIGSYQLLEVWVRDALQNPISQHAHDADEYIISLGGRTLFIMSGVPFTLIRGNMLQIPSGAPHSAFPMNTDCHLLVMTMPAASEYSPRADT